MSQAATERKRSSVIINRRQALAGLAAAGLAPLLPGRARAQELGERFLIVLTGTGGASLIDAMLAIRESESRNAATVNTYPDAMVQGIEGTPFRAIDRRLDDLGPLPYTGVANQSDFVRRHARDMCVLCHSVTSVNHLVAQKRALTGNDAWNGRTLQEMVAATYGARVPVPNVNMGSGGYIAPGIDPDLPGRARAEPVLQAPIWSLGLDGSKGVAGAPPRSAISMARRWRDGELDEQSVFNQTFAQSSALKRWKRQRSEQMPAMEQAGLIKQLTFLASSPQMPLEEFGLDAAPDAARVRQVFPNYETDPLEAQAALAYLLIKNRVTVAVTLGPNITPQVDAGGLSTPPLAFDYSHTAHRSGQALMWSWILNVADRLIGLLKEAEYADGESFWDRSLLYFATDFGRTKTRPADADEFGTGHHINNGSLLVSPMVKGNTVLGGVDADTGETYGFDRSSGAPEPGSTLWEPDVYAGIVQAMGIDTSGSRLPDMRAVRRS